MKPTVAEFLGSYFFKTDVNIKISLLTLLKLFHSIKMSLPGYKNYVSRSKIINENKKLNFERK